MQGGDCGSSIWRGGSPTQWLKTAFAGSPAGGVGVGDGWAVPVAPFWPLPNFDVCSEGACLICWAWGANSAIAGGGCPVARRARDITRRRTTTAPIALTIPGTRPRGAAPAEELIPTLIDSL